MALSRRRRMSGFNINAMYARVQSLKQSRITALVALKRRHEVSEISHQRRHPWRMRLFGDTTTSYISESFSVSGGLRQYVLVKA